MTLRELSFVVAFFAGLFLIVAAVSWWRVVREPEQEPTEGRVSIDSRRVKSAAMTTSIAFGLSGIAAILAVLDWFLRD